MTLDGSTDDRDRALKARAGKDWSVTHGRGTAYGWINITAPKARRTWAYRLKADAKGTMPEDYEGFDSREPDGYMTPADRAELAKALGLDSVHEQGERVAASTAHYEEYIDRANGRTPRRIGQQYWD